MPRTPLSSVLRYLHHVVAPKLEQSGDGELLHAFVSRSDEASFAALVRRYGALVLNVCRHVLGHEQDAEDAFQATFLVLARKAASLRDAGSLASFLHGIAYRLSLRAKRDAALRRKHERQAPMPTPQGTDELVWREVQALVEEEIERLPRKYRTPFILCYLQGLSRAEAAGELGIKEGTVWSRLSWARRRLQERLSRRGVALSAALATLALSDPIGAAALPRLSEAVWPAVRMFAEGRPLADAVSMRAARLAQAGMHTFAIGKGKMTGIVLVLLLATGTGGAIFRALTPPAATEQPQTKATLPPSKESAPARLDLNGDPLPEGAVARLGTVRFRMGGLVYACAWSPDGKILAASSVDKEIALFDGATGRQLRQLQGSSFSATSLAFAPDSRTLAAGDENGRITLWNCDTAKMVRQFRASVGDPIHPVWSLAFMPDGKGLISAGEDKMIRLWDPATGKEVRRFTGHQNEVRCAVLSSDGKLLASAADSDIRIWETASGKMIHRLTRHKEAIRGLAISADGKLLASGSKDGMVYLWDTATGTVRRPLPEDAKQLPGTADSHAHALAFSPDGRILVFGGSDYRLSLLDAAKWAKFFDMGRIAKNTLAGGAYHDGGVQCIAFSPDGKKMVHGRDNVLDCGSVSSDKEFASFEHHYGAVWQIFFRSDDRHLFTTSDDPDRRILEWDAASGRLIRRVPGKTGFASLVGFSPDGKLMAAPQHDRRYLLLLDTINGKEVRKIALPLKEGSNSIQEVSFSPDGKQLAVVGPMGNSAWLFDASTGKQLRSMGPGKDWTFSHAQFSSDSRLLAIAGNEAIQILDLTSDRQLPTIPLLKDRISFAPALSPDGRTLALASAEWVQETLAKKDSHPSGSAPRALKVRDITLWETASGKKRGSFPSPCSGVRVLAYSPDGRLLAFAGEDRVVHILDTVKGEWLRHWQGHRDDITTLVFSHDGRRLASGSHDTSALIWDVSRLAKEPPRRAPLPREKLDELWTTLAGADAEKAYRAILTLGSVPDQSVPLLAERLHFKPSADAKKIAGLIARLDSADFAERERATTELRRLGWEVEPDLLKVLESKPSLEARQRVKALLEEIRKQAPPPELLRMLRGIEILEHIGTREARKVIASLADGRTRVVSEAKAALNRHKKGAR
jgi:RNA polymerase sigma factor (sigma-70 family)